MTTPDRVKTVIGTSNTVIIGFYSFKGGVGRTLAAAHLAYFYSRANKSVLLVDADLEAPGLSFWSPPSQEDQDNGLVKLLADLTQDHHGSGATTKSDSHPLHITDYLQHSNPFFSAERGRFPEAMSKCKQRIDLLPTGIGPSVPGYVERLLPTQEAFRDNTARLKSLFQASGYDVVLIDSRTGLHGIPAAVISELSDYHVILFGPGRQNLLGFRAALDLLGPQLIEHSVFAMSPVGWEGGRRLEEAARVLREKLRGREQSTPRITTISWHPSLAMDEQLITVTDPSSVTAHNYQELFVELETVRGHGVEEFTGAIDALLDIYKAVTTAHTVNMMQQAFKEESEAAFGDVSSHLSEALGKCVRRIASGEWGKWETRAGLIGVIIWEIIRRLKSLADLDEYASEALWGIVIRRNRTQAPRSPERYRDVYELEGAREGLPVLLEPLEQEYERQFGRSLTGLKSWRASGRDLKEIELEAFLQMKGELL